MTRTSGDEIRHGRVWNGFDYNLQVWILEGIVQSCAHPDWMRLGGKACCNQFALAGKNILDIPGAQSREEHKQDSDCTLDQNHTCTICGVYHGDPCAKCKGRGYHREGCPWLSKRSGKDTNVQ